MGDVNPNVEQQTVKAGEPVPEPLGAAEPEAATKSEPGKDAEQAAADSATQESPQVEQEQASAGGGEEQEAQPKS